MTKEMAIQVLQTALTAPFIYGDYAEAIDMAIEALQVKTEGDSISRQDAIKAIDGDIMGGLNYRRILQSLPSAEAIQEWIPVSERLPEVDVEVLTTTDWSDVLIAWLNKDGAWETEEFILNNDEILAWMPLPKPYKGGEEE